MESGDLAKLCRFFLKQLQEFMGRVQTDMGRLFVGELDKELGVVGLLYPGVEFRAIQQSAQFVQFGNVDELPSDELLFLVVEPFLFFFPEVDGLGEGDLFVGGADQAQLFVELRGVLSFTADDPEYQFAEIPVHALLFFKVKAVMQSEGLEKMKLLCDQGFDVL
jgi:hypothetical protein